MNKDLRRKRHNIRGTSDVWWYEDREGINIIVRHTIGNIKSYRIPWRYLRYALKRKEKP